jgi:hypothetical protein
LRFPLFGRKKGKDLDLEVQNKFGVTAVGLRVKGKLAAWGIGVPRRTETELGAGVSPTNVSAEGARKRELDWQWWYVRKNMGPFGTLDQMKVSTTGVAAIVTGSQTVSEGPYSEWKGEKELRIEDVHIYSKSGRAADIILHPTGSDVFVQLETKRKSRIA